MTGILLMVTRHRLVVGGTHDDTHTVGQFAILRVIGIESPSPHGWPKEVTLQTEDQLKDLLIEAVVAIVRSEGVLHPTGEAGRLVVEEDATELDGRLAVRVRTFYDISLIVLSDRSVSPPVPR